MPNFVERPASYKDGVEEWLLRTKTNDNVWYKVTATHPFVLHIYKQYEDKLWHKEATILHPADDAEDALLRHINGGNNLEYLR